MDVFELAIHAPTDAGFPLTATTAVGEQARGLLRLLPPDPACAVVLEKLATRDRTTPFTETEVIALGQWLAALLFQDKVAALLQSAMTQALLTDQPLQLRVVIADDPAMVPVLALPWEFLAGDDGLPLATSVSLVRSMPSARPMPALQVADRLTLLLAWALPVELAEEAPLDIAAEVDALTTQVQPLVDRGQLTLALLPQATPLALQRAIRDHRPHIVHVLSHGRWSWGDAPQLVLDDGAGGIQLVSPRQLGVVLQRSGVRLVVLNACQSATQGGTLWQAFGPALLAVQIPAVVGMQASVLDRAGRMFTDELYRTLVATASIDQAVQVARTALIMTDLSQVDWGLATLYLRARDGQLFGQPTPGAAPDPLTARAVPMMAPALETMPLVARPALLRVLKEALIGGAATPAHALVALCGAPGFGKTTLAAMVGHDPEVQAAFPDGVLWVTLGEQPAIPHAMGVLYQALTQERPHFLSDEDAASQLGQVLATRRCLIILDDVWWSGTLAWFQRLRTPSRWLITTRMRNLVPAAAMVTIDAMALDEAVALLSCQLIPPPPDLTALQPLVAQLGAWPLLLAQIGTALVEQLSYGQALPAAVAYVREQLARAGIDAFDPPSAALGEGKDGGRRTAVAASLQLSLRMLAPPAQTRLQELAICPGATPIPLVIAGRLWGTDALVTMETALAAARCSLVILDLQQSTIQVHPMLRAYLASRLGDQQAVLHQRLLATWQDQPWHALIVDPYLRDHLRYHVHAAWGDAALIAMLLDVRYLARRMAQDDVAAGLQDVGEGTRLVPASAELAALARQLPRIVPALVPAQGEHELRLVLLTRLAPLLPDVPLAAAARAWLAPPVLLPRGPLPDLPDLSFVRAIIGHAGPVHSCALSPDGQTLVSGAWDHTVRVWDVATGTLRHTLLGHAGPVTHCAIDALGTTVVSVSQDRTVRVWDAVQGTLRHCLMGHTDGVLGCAISADGRTVASASWDQTVRLWDGVTGAERATLTGHTAGVWRCALSRDGVTVISVSGDYTARIWDAASGVLRHRLHGHADDVTGCALDGSGTLLATTSWDGTLRLWDVASGAPLRALPAVGSVLWTCALSADGRVAIAVATDGLVRVWDTHTGTLLQTFTGPVGMTQGCALSADATIIAAASEDRCLRLWRRDPTARPASAPLRQLTQVRLSPGGTWLVALGQDGTLTRWDAQRGTLVQRLGGWNVPATGCWMTPDGGTVVAAGADDTIAVWARDWALPRHVLTGHTATITACAVSADGRTLVSISWDATVRVWDLAQGALRQTLMGPTSAMRTGALSADGTTVVSADEAGVVWVWHAATGALRHQLHGHTREVWDCAVSATGQLVASASLDGTVRLWNGQTGALLHELTGHTDEVTACALTPDGQTLISLAADQTLRVWDTRSGGLLTTLGSVDAQLLAGVISDDGTTVVTISDQRHVQVWQRDRGAAVVAFRADGPLTTCAVSQDGRLVVAGGRHGLYWLGHVRTAAELTAALTDDRMGALREGWATDE